MSIASHRLRKYYEKLEHTREEHLVAIAERILNRFMLLSTEIKMTPPSAFELSIDWGLLSGIVQGHLVGIQCLSKGNIIGKVAYIVHSYKLYHHLYKRKDFLAVEYLALERWLDVWNKHYEAESLKAGVEHRDRTRTIQAMRKFDQHNYK